MIFGLILLLTVIMALLSGGKIENFKNMEIRWVWLAVVVILIKIITYTDLRHLMHLSDTLASRLYFISLFFLALFLVSNLRLRGMLLASLGLLGNFLAMAFNSWYMPIKGEYISLLATSQEIQTVHKKLPFLNAIPTGPDTKFYYLCDIFKLPDWFFFNQVFSIGDILITFGVALFIWTFLRKTGDTRTISSLYYR
ncbi:DUF5317 domain-containing protein [Desulforamulus ruminis]|uniref:Uncharacterized protein n=1 Tax=Desulforamulus ruminis (strain ATCC 23193 / DSM 2154 / NCIMB 8452 / DL) TaxID=696281 RepID=F6DNZ4_DESRL|nr:DUF5317 domain-containing protein [Desulforamulus ruminis]AEG60713.1 hypothetical protein Desru_2480 [Desulforamulus ruminis DSM 2154]